MQLVETEYKWLGRAYQSPEILNFTFMHSFLGPHVMHATAERDPASFSQGQLYNAKRSKLQLNQRV